ncbi:2-dehydro-3-deoxyphosphogluconate aldolase/4-hydroxy-2-oxoglutarate aldolase [Haloarcula marismortui ATCC 43049]|uniref:2-dehydro-3-deoxyphosphogluconate aldolase/4-hydroxy-2-oxoglutarate aldolase n=8 Tax=Haloarcula TaxID=2237 RepID=Q5UY23_HALMA|nr:2-dehydro-3-deoxyphosphogluconate aldolase/4-hydroxy-2-oxoglutarate aldolase [Haloarcula marismortui ATCC 43049]
MSSHQQWSPSERFRSSSGCSPDAPAWSRFCPPTPPPTIWAITRSTPSRCRKLRTTPVTGAASPTPPNSTHSTRLPTRWHPAKTSRGPTTTTRRARNCSTCSKARFTSKRPTGSTSSRPTRCLSPNRTARTTRTTPPMPTNQSLCLASAHRRPTSRARTTLTRNERSGGSDTLFSHPVTVAPMTSKQAVQQELVDSGVTAVLRGIPEEKMVDVATAVHEGGVTALELTADAKRCSDMIAAVDKALDDTDAIIGAGTVMDAAAARNVIEAGAEFVLAPNLNEDVIDVCNREGVLAIPGVMTPTEAADAMEAGADILKMFPAKTVGPAHIGALQGPLGDVPIMPTGGVSTDNVDEFFDAGAVAVGAGSALVNYEAIENDDMDGVREQAAAFVDAVEAARE